MQWEKYGVLWMPDGKLDWAQSHAALPMVLDVGPNCWWVFVGCRDARGKSHIARLEVDTRPLPGAPPCVRRIHPQPVLSLGEPGTFDDSGVMPGWLVRDADVIRLYYTGWNVVGTVPYRLSIGLASSTDGGKTFERCSRGPIIDRSVNEPFFATSPCVHKESDTWRMWYVSCTGWQEISGRWEPAYHVKYAESRDGIDWRCSGISCVDVGEGWAVARPCVFRKEGGYAMLYPFRSLMDYRNNRNCGYRLGYAESDDGIDWRRMDARAGITLSATGWDSDMIEYPWLQRHGGETYLLYNGNGFGQSGFGLARLTSWD